MSVTVKELRNYIKNIEDDVKVVVPEKGSEKTVLHDIDLNRLLFGDHTGPIKGHAEFLTINIE